jgi:hypothetical protein
MRGRFTRTTRRGRLHHPGEHIDRFHSLEDAKKAAGPNSVAPEAHGGVWLMTVEGKTKDHHGGRHVALIGQLTLPAAEGYTMRPVILA